MTEHSFEEWTPEERAQLADVGQHRSPRSELKGRTMRDLRERGLLGAAGSRTPSRFAFALAAAVVVFAAGMLAGYGVGLRHQGEARRDSVTGAGLTHEVARLDSPSAQGATAATGRHVIWF